MSMYFEFDVGLVDGVRVGVAVEVRVRVAVGVAVGVAVRVAVGVGFKLYWNINIFGIYNIPELSY